MTRSVATSLPRPTNRRLPGSNGIRSAARNIACIASGGIDMRRTALVVCALIAIALPVIRAQTPPIPARPVQPGNIPVRRVILYKNGIGYFEHVGRVSGNQTVTVAFNSTQLNDVLKTLTTIDLGNGRVTGVSYNSQAPLTQRLDGLRLPVGEHATLPQLLDALRGARIEARTGDRVVTGRLLGVEEHSRSKNGETTATEEITLVGDTGDIRVVEITPAVTVRLAERDSTQQVGAYMGLLASARGSDQRQLKIATAGTGDRDLLVSYISEVPVWKTTYRIVLPARGGAPLLQAWAIVDNTIGEDWQNVELSLVAGAPQSFLQQLSQPLYAQRPVVPLPRSLLVMPQTHQGTITDESEGTEAKALESSTMRTRVEGGVTGGIVGGLESAPANGNGIASGRGGGVYRPGSPTAVAAPVPPPPSREEIETRIVQTGAAALGGDVGDLFEYKISEPISILKNQSALVPILNHEVGAERVSLWNSRVVNGRPLRSLWLTNASGSTLDGGSFSVLDAGAFAGEGLVDAMKPGEKRLLSYAVDLGVQVEPRNGDDQRTVSRISIARGLLVQHSERLSRRVYTMRNNDTTDRRIVIEHPIRAGWSLASAAKPAETSVDAYRFVVTVPAKKTETFTVAEQQPLSQTYRIADITSQQVDLLVRESGGDSGLRNALAPILAAKATVATRTGELNSRAAETKRIGEDQSRVGENMKALKGSSEEQQLLKRYAAQLAQQEDRVALLRRETDDLERRRRDAQAELARLVDNLTTEVAVTP